MNQSIKALELKLEELNRLNNEILDDYKRLNESFKDDTHFTAHISHFKKNTLQSIKLNEEALNYISPYVKEKGTMILAIAGMLEGFYMQNEKACEYLDGHDLDYFYEFIFDVFLPSGEKLFKATQDINFSKLVDLDIKQAFRELIDVINKLNKQIDSILENQLIAHEYSTRTSLSHTLYDIEKQCCYTAKLIETKYSSWVLGFFF